MRFSLAIDFAIEEEFCVSVDSLQLAAPQQATQDCLSYHPPSSILDLLI
ncbi:MAG: hypothetical protein KDC99_18020 [Cyclobacteriaceae bacterium]|nr:hypothetical protein [Cyclobacteriaceae bacterium]